MTPDEQNLISSLFERLRKSDTAPKDAEAEQLIRQKVAESPGAPYLLVQSVLVLEHALANAQSRIADLEKQLAAANQNQKPAHGGFLSGLFGGGRQHDDNPPQGQPQAGRQASPPPPQPLPQAQQYSAPPPTPYPSTVNMQPGSGGSFLKGALSTAAGVAGGALLFRGVEDLIGQHAGPFGSVMGTQGGFLPQEAGPTEVVNNYYNVNEDPQNAQTVGDLDPGNQGGVTDQNVDYDPGQNVDYDPGQDANLDTVDDNFDSGGGGDDSTYV